jgi:hypothetical protein
MLPTIQLNSFALKQAKSTITPTASGGETYSQRSDDLSKYQRRNSSGVICLRSCFDFSIPTLCQPFPQPAERDAKS